MMILFTSAGAYFPLGNSTASAKHQLTPKGLLENQKWVVTFFILSPSSNGLSLTPIATLLLLLFIQHIHDFSTMSCFMIYNQYLPGPSYVLNIIMSTGDTKMITVLSLQCRCLLPNPGNGESDGCYGSVWGAPFIYLFSKCLSTCYAPVTAKYWVYNTRKQLWFCSHTQGGYNLV